MKVAVFSDVHGNAIALHDVLADARTVGVDEHWIVGDLVAHGPQPAETLRRLISLSPKRCVRGNTDRYVVRGELPAVVPQPSTATTAADVQLLVDVSRAFAWTRGAVTAIGAYDWLAAVPLEDRVTLPDGSRVLLVHAAPGTDDGAGLQPEMTDEESAAAGIADCAADLVFVGHTHVPLDRTVSGVRVINLGSVSVPGTSDKRAMWTLLTADESGYSIERRYVDYDRAALLRSLDEVHYPGADWLRTKFED